MEGEGGAGGYVDGGALGGRGKPCFGATLRWALTGVTMCALGRHVEVEYSTL